MSASALWTSILLAALSYCGSQAAESPFKQENKPCDPDCSKYGNCNGETGQCDCPFGLKGPACTERLFPACHSTHENGTLPHYGTWYPKNCYCAKQLHAFACPPHIHFEGHHYPGKSPCLYELVHSHVLCYRYRNVPESQQLSDSPPLDHPDVEWVQRMGPDRERVLNPDEVPKEVKTPDDGKWQPLQDCPNKCNHRGWCQIKGVADYARHEDPNEKWCQCHSFFRGDSCEIADNYHCYRNCSGVGTCKSGWCHCQEGYWGHGCTRTKAYTSSAGWRPAFGDTKIYVYDLPENVMHRREFQDKWPTIDLMYNSELQFTEQLLADWGVRTENPWEATLFYVPTFTYWYTGNIGEPWVPMMHVTHWLMHNSPFWNATGGRNHIMWATNDRGTCSLQYAPLEMQHSIKIVHFGQSPRRTYMHLKHGDAQRLAAGAGAAGLGGALPLPGNRFKEFPAFTAKDILDEHEMCIRPEKDVVAPNYLNTGWLEPERYNKVWNVQILPNGDRVVTRRLDAEPRDITLFFGGYTKPFMTYSQGVRQALSRMFGAGGPYAEGGPKHRKDYMIMGPAHDAPHRMQHSKFCLAPMGAGWGIRLAEAMVTGCVPVIVQDHVYQALWDVLPYEEFSLRVPRSELHRIVDILDDVTPQQLEQLQIGVEKWHRAFAWDVYHGGLAYNFTVASLKRKAVSMWSVNYRRRHSRSRSLLATVAGGGS